MHPFKKMIFKICSNIEATTSFNFSTANGSGTTGYTTACPISTYEQVFHCADNPIVTGSILYDDAVGGTEVVGANLWYKEQSSNKSYRIDNLGNVIADFQC